MNTRDRTIQAAAWGALAASIATWMLLDDWRYTLIGAVLLLAGLNATHRDTDRDQQP